MRGLLIHILLTLCISMLAGCAGARSVMTFDNLQYPASMSGLIYGSNDEVLSGEADLAVVGNFKYEKMFWGIFYSQVPLSDGKDIVDALNREIATVGGEGVVNLSLTSTQCGINGLFLLTWLPIMPGCVDVVVECEIVKAKPRVTGYFKSPLFESDTARFYPNARISKAVAMMMKSGQE